MLKMMSVSSPTLNAGAFSVTFGDVAIIKNDVFAGATGLSGTAASNQAVITVNNTTNFTVGQSVLIQDTAGHNETRIITVVTPGVSIQVGVNLTNTYTVANGSTVTALVPKVLVGISNPFAQAAGSAQFLGTSFTVSGTTVTVTIDKATAGAGPVLPYTWANAVTADVEGCIVTVIADCE